MKRFTVFMAALLLSAPAFAQLVQTGRPVGEIVEMELLTSSELVEKQKAGFINVIIANGGTEARGPQNILAGHTIMSKHTAIDAAKIIGNTLVAPVMPIDVGATGVSDGSNIPGGITVSREIFKGLKLAEIESQVWNGFKNIFVMGDHGGGQQMMKEAAEEMNTKYASRGVHVYYVPDFYSKYQDEVQLYFYEQKLPIGGHGAMMETSKMLFLEPAPGVVRAADLQDGAVRSDGADAGAVEGGARRASRARGRDRPRRESAGAAARRRWWWRTSGRIRMRRRASTTACRAIRIRRRKRSARTSR